jgi:hypothetical protein
MFNMPIQNAHGPVGAINFKDVWDNRVSFTLVALEEAEYKRWTWGRFAILGDGIHKMTPNAGAGGNNAIESAAALANSLHDLRKSTKDRHPTLQEIEGALNTYHKTREIRVAAAVTVAIKLTRVQALRGLGDRLLAHYLIPLVGGDFLQELQSDMAIGAEFLHYLPIPLRSLESNMPFNPEQGVGKKENLLIRALIAVPFIALTVLAAQNLSPTAEALQAVGKAFHEFQASWHLDTLPLIGPIFRTNLVNGMFWRPFAFATQWESATESVSSWQLPSFLADYGVLYAILLIESTRRANAVNIFAH